MVSPFCLKKVVLSYIVVGEAIIPRLIYWDSPTILLWTLLVYYLLTSHLLLGPLLNENHISQPQPPLTSKSTTIAIIGSDSSLAAASLYRRKGIEGSSQELLNRLRVAEGGAFEEEEEEENNYSPLSSSSVQPRLCSRFCVIVHRLFCRSSSRESLWTVIPRKIKTTSPLSYLLQAAMGQCSTLPEARNSSSAARHEGGMRDNSSRQRLKEDGRTESLDFNKLTTASNENTKAVDQRKLHVTVPTNGDNDGASFAKFSQMQTDMNQPQARDQEHSNGMPEPMDVDQRDGSQPLYLPPPPENAVRARCYKLNLDSEMVGITSSSKSHQLCLGPFSEPPPQLTYSSSEDSSINCSATNVAIQTAQIFRGITISKDGTILSQNARATRSNRGNKTKRGEKSRQAAKIDKAKDLVEEAMVTGKVSPKRKKTFFCLEMFKRILTLTILSSFIYIFFLNRTETLANQRTWYLWSLLGDTMT